VFGSKQVLMPVSFEDVTEYATLQHGNVSMPTSCFLSHLARQLEDDRISATALLTAPKLRLNDFWPSFSFCQCRFGQVSAEAASETWFRQSATG